MLYSLRSTWRAPSRVTIWRILKRHGLVTPEPHKQPKASFVRFEAALPNEMWQTDDRLDGDGRVTLRYLSRLRHFHVSYKRRRQEVMLLVAGDHVRVIADDGELLRELTLDPDRDYQPSTAPTLVRHQVRQRSAST